MRYLIILFVLLFIALTVRPAISYYSRDKMRLGLKENRLLDCPDSPNCVSSGASRESQLTSAFVVDENGSDTFQLLIKLIAEQPRAEIMSSNESYVHATFRTKLLGYIDDLELQFLPGSDVIEVKSGSRLGHSDFGVNRKRIDTLRILLDTRIDERIAQDS